MVFQKYQKQQDKLIRDELMNHVDREQSVLQSLAFDKTRQIDVMAGLGQLTTGNFQK